MPEPISGIVFFTHRKVSNPARHLVPLRAEEDVAQIPLPYGLRVLKCC